MLDSLRHCARTIAHRLLPIIVLNAAHHNINHDIIVLPGQHFRGVGSGDETNIKMASQRAGLTHDEQVLEAIFNPENPVTGLEVSP